MVKTTLAVLALFGLGIGAAAAREPKETPAIKAAKEMVKAWNDVNLDRIVDCFTEDGVLHSVMTEPVKGRAALRAHLAPLIAGATRIDLRLKNVAAVGNIVFLERVDDFDFKGKHGAVPVVGVMEIENGKVKVWREYYDRATLLREMGLPPAP
jgi:uncharacterized protein (TIGR02246 family)